jgi:hypothetical protein
MKQTITSICFAIIAAVITPMTSKAQTLKTPAPSPLQTLKQAFALSEIGIEYSRPSAKGRVIFGDLVPFGKTWRTGANGATKLTFGENVKIEGNAVPAGTYALYTVPNKDNWEIIIYKDLKVGGNVANMKKEDELVRFSVKSSKLTEKVETFTLNVADITASKANIELTWENTKVSFSVVADIDAAIMADIDKTINTDNRPYFQAANYYFENDKDLTVALTWVNKAIEQNPKAFWVMMLKAKIENKMKDYKSCMATCDKVVELAKAASNDDYVKMAETLKAEAKNAK